VIDNTVIDSVKEKVEISTFFAPFAKLYKVPYKAPKESIEQYALNIIKNGLNETAFQNYSNDIIQSFKKDSKPIDKPRVQELLKNTLLFLESFKD